MEPHGAVADEDERTDVALLEPVAAQAFENGLLQLLEGHGNVEQVDVRRLVEAAQVLRQPEHRRAAVGGAVAADALEDAEPVVERVGEDVDAGLVPVHELAVEPDRLARDARCRVVAHRASAGLSGGGYAR